MLDARESVIALSYIVAAVLFIFGLKQLSSPATARAGNRLAAIGMTVIAKTSDRTERLQRVVRALMSLI